jgi:predicted glycoside hydrolase/deacetylase ChbG (UPF0249 family)
MIKQNLPLKGTVTEHVLFFFILFAFIQGCGTPPTPKTVDSDKRYLIINGDDLCLDERTDEAILEAYHEGILTSTSAFINLPGSVDRLKEIHLENADLPVGLHLNLTLGRPVSDPSDVKGIVDKNGDFYDISKILRHLSKMPVDDVRKEFMAQAALFVSTGVPLDHIDYHHHLAALYTPFFEVVREVALAYDVPVRNPVPASIYKMISLDSQGGGGSSSMKKLILFGITHPFKSLPMMSKIGPEAFIEQEKQMAKEGIKSSDWFIDCFYENASTENFISILQQLPMGVSEIMCHPGMDEELKVLTDGRLKQVTDSLQIELVSWSHVH